jgi:dolichol-phosphate mannosyltransferase
MPLVSLVIPAFNESEIILHNVDELAAWMTSNAKHISFEILVVDDGSTDGMGDLLEEACLQRNWLRVAHHPVNMGRGLGVRTGFSKATGDYIVCLDADLSYSPDHVLRLLDPLMAGEADITLASVYHPEGQVINVPGQRVFLSRFGNRILSLGFGGDLYRSRLYPQGCE